MRDFGRCWVVVCLTTKSCGLDYGWMVPFSDAPTSLRGVSGSSEGWDMLGPLRSMFPEKLGRHVWTVGPDVDEDMVTNKNRWKCLKWCA